MRPVDDEVAEAIHRVADKISDFGHAGAVNAGEGGQGVMEVFGFKLCQSLDGIARALQEVAEAINDAK